jgi:hypothetical protein
VGTGSSGVGATANDFGFRKTPPSKSPYLEDWKRDEAIALRRSRITAVSSFGVVSLGFGFFALRRRLSRGRDEAAAGAGSSGETPASAKKGIVSPTASSERIPLLS